MMQARSALQSFAHVLVLSGDVPLIRPQTIERLRDFHIDSDAAMTVLTARPDDPTGYGRVFRRTLHGRPTDELERIVEQKSLRDDEGEQREVNSGIYAFATKPLFKHIDQLTTEEPRARVLPHRHGRHPGRCRREGAGHGSR